ncbi:hypothetical protein HAZT_HAZT010834 [Hyalella azteca]|uniref:Phosphatidic acid phosphatase type 2/haloperoxidase domain-containing protein n=1 Tax=Hyalella azteca TaxID=294128 RepID=A0A6A0GR65_HYAAZ|nr:hypothetical protein HAZT_HAZT010834 [Hyalella azteca]
MVFFSISVIECILFCRSVNSLEPFDRVLHAEELWLYKNPMSEEFVPVYALWALVVGIPCIIFMFHFVLTFDAFSTYNTFMAFSLAVVANSLIVNTMQVMIGRPRPDFLQRCFPDGVVKWPSGDPDGGLGIGGVDFSALCTGNPEVILEGRKSFPSGCASLSFCGLGYLSLWLCQQFSVFTTGRAQAWRFVLAMAPLGSAAFIALSRTCDYLHHWQDVLVGAMLGWSLAFVCYRLYHPRPACSCQLLEAPSCGSSRLGSPANSNHSHGLLS